jgi:hypothetical protein
MRTIDAGRIDHVRDICTTAIARDGLTDRAWLAQSVLNILDGKIDVQIIAENKET